MDYAWFKTFCLLRTRSRTRRVSRRSHKATDAMSKGWRRGEHTQQVTFQHSYRSQLSSAAHLKILSTWITTHREIVTQSPAGSCYCLVYCCILWKPFIYKSETQRCFISQEKQRKWQRNLDLKRQPFSPKIRLQCLYLEFCTSLCYHLPSQENSYFLLFAVDLAYIYSLSATD